MDMDMVRPWKDPWQLSPSLRPWEAWAALRDLLGRARPVGPPRSSHDAYVGGVCHCHCGSDHRRRHPVRLVWVNGSFARPTIAARTADLIVHTLPAFTSIYRSYLSVFERYHLFLRSFYRLCTILGSCGDPDPSVCLRKEAPSPVVVLGTRCHAWV